MLHDDKALFLYAVYGRPPLITQFITIGLPKLPNSDKFVQTSLAPAREVSCFQTDVIRRNQPRVCHRKAIIKPLPHARVFSAIRRAQNKQWSRVGKCLACEFVFLRVIINTCCHSRSLLFFSLRNLFAIVIIVPYHYLKSSSSSAAIQITRRIQLRLVWWSYILIVIDKRRHGAWRSSYCARETGGMLSGNLLTGS